MSLAPDMLEDLREQREEIIGKLGLKALQIDGRLAWRDRTSKPSRDSVVEELVP